MICNRCKKDSEDFYPNTSVGAWCRSCIYLERSKRPNYKRQKAKKLYREQESILNLIKQFQENGESYVYLLLCGDRYKIGYSKNIFSRVRTFNTASPIPHKVIAVVPGDKQLEKELHIQLKLLRVFGEWFLKKPPVFETFKKLPGVMIFLPGYVTKEAPSPSCRMDSQPQ